MHWLHSTDQLIFHIGSTCHTTDEYYRVLCELREDRQFAIVSSFSEAKRSESGTVLAKEVLADTNEVPVNYLRSEATLIQNESRKIIAQPALDAAKFELWVIDRLIKQIEPTRTFKGMPDPVAHQRIQYYENIADLAWKAFVEFRTFNSLSLETIAQILARDLPISESLLEAVKNRTDLYKHLCEVMGWDTSLLSFVTPDLLDSLRETVNMELDECGPMQAYIDSFDGNYIEAMQNVVSKVGGICEQVKITNQRS